MSAARFLRIARLRLRSLLRRGALDDELNRELAFHLDRLLEEKAADGLPAAAARQSAVRVLGNVTALEESCRDQRRVGWIHDLAHDALHGARLLRKRPVFAATATSAIALAVGANAAILTAIAVVRFAPLPFPDADRLVAIRTVPPDPSKPDGAAAVADYDAWHDRNRSFQSMGVSLGWRADLAADPDGTPPERLNGETSTPSLFTTLGVTPQVGRLFVFDDIRQGHPVILISDSFWARRFGRDPGIVNRRIRVDGVDRTIIGVMPADFRYEDRRVDFWLPLLPLRKDNPARLFMVAARLAPGVTIAQAQADMSGVAADLAREAPAQNAGWGTHVLPLRSALYGWTMTPLLTFEGAAVLMLLAACANVAGLLLARGTSRQRELAVRAALGAERGRLRRQLLAESVVIAGAAAMLAVPVARFCLQGLEVTITPPAGLPPMAPLDLGALTVGLVAAIAVAAGLLAGLAPSLTVPPRDLLRALRATAPSSRPASRHHGLRDALIVGEMTVAVVLLVGAGLLLSSLLRLKGRDLQFDSRELVALEFHVTPPRATPAGTIAGAPAFTFSPAPAETIRRVHEALRAAVGADAVAGISQLFTSRLVPTSAVSLETPAASAPVRFSLVTPGFFTAVKATLVRGRDLDDGDSAQAEPVVVVNETAARQLWPGGDSIGRRLTLHDVLGDRPREVVGVVRDIPLWVTQTDHVPVVYVPSIQYPNLARIALPGLPSAMTFLIRSSDAEGAASSARRIVSGVAPDRPLMPIGTVDDLRFPPALAIYVLVLGGFAAVVLLLAAVGVHGVVAQAVNVGAREIGIRRALGAGARDILAGFGGRAIVLILAGWTLGAIAAVPLVRLLAPQLWTVSPTDPATFAAASAILAIASLAACLAPFWRAVRIDPTVILRQE